MKHLEVFETQAAAELSKNNAEPRVRLITADNLLAYFPEEVVEEEVPAE